MGPGVPPEEPTAGTGRPSGDRRPQRGPLVCGLASPATRSPIKGTKCVSSAHLLPGGDGNSHRGFSGRRTLHSASGDDGRRHISLSPSGSLVILFFFCPSPRFLERRPCQRAFELLFPFHGTLTLDRLPKATFCRGCSVPERGLVSPLPLGAAALTEKAEGSSGQGESISSWHPHRLRSTPAHSPQVYPQPDSALPSCRGSPRPPWPPVLLETPSTPAPTAACK